MISTHNTNKTQIEKFMPFNVEWQRMGDVDIDVASATSQAFMIRFLSVGCEANAHSRRDTFQLNSDF